MGYSVQALNIQYLITIGDEQENLTLSFQDERNY